MLNNDKKKDNGLVENYANMKMHIYSHRYPKEKSLKPTPTWVYILYTSSY